jgi:hypothetical protein
MIDVQAASPTFLAWLARQAHHPDPLEFLATPDGTAMMPRDLEHLIVHLDALGLVHAGRWRTDARLPQAVSLSKCGRHCVLSFDGDVTAWHTAAAHAGASGERSVRTEAGGPAPADRR